MAKKQPFDMGEYIVSDKDIEAYRWCIKNDIKISPTAKTQGSWWLDIVNKGVINRSPQAFIKGVIWQKMYEYYNYYYDKYKK